MSTVIKAPLREILVEIQDPRTRGTASKRFEDFLIAITGAVPSYQALIATDFGLGGKGTSDDTAGLQRAVDQAASMGGATILMPPGTYSIGSVRLPPGDAPVTLLGFGGNTVLRRRSVLPDGLGMLDIRGSNVTLDNLVLDGDVTTPTGLIYNGGFSTADGANDPMATSLTKNSLTWVHGPTSNFKCQRVTFRHASGYSSLVDAMSGGIYKVRFLDCCFENCRPHLFGTVAGQELYGSWTGGILFRGDGRAANPGRVIKRMKVSGCEFLRNAGNCVWMHALGLNDLHEDVQFSDNYFLDCGLDGILVGACTGGSVVGNVFRRIGYVCSNDTGQSTPRWLQNVNATALDSSGLVKSVVYADNSMLSVNGGNIDCDGHGESTFSGNVCRVPYADEPEYEEDQIAISGATNNGSTSYGVNISNTSGSAYGAAHLNIVGNTLINLRAGAIRAYAARKCFITGNSIIAPPNSVFPPVAMGPIGPNVGQRCYSNRVSGNKIDYAPTSAAPAIFEDDTYSAFLASEANAVFNNGPITPSGTLASEFLPSPTSGSVHYSEQVWFP